MDFIKYLILFFILIIAVISDIKSRKIPNKLTFPAIILGLVINLVISFIEKKSLLMSLRLSLLGFITGIGIYFIPFAIGGFGAGDVKLIAAVGSFMGTRFTLLAGIYSFIIGGVLAILLLLIKTISGNKEENLNNSIKNIFNFFTYKTHIIPSKSTLPFSFSIFLSVILRLYIVYFLS